MLTKDMNAFLPADVSGLQSMVLALRDKMEKTEEVVRNHELENQLLRERIRLLQHQLYGRKSERFTVDDDFEQSSLFDDANESAEATEPETVEEITVPSHKRKKRGRKRLADSLRRIEIVHDIDEDEKQCGCGCEMSRIGQEVSERLEMQPARFWVERHIRPKYACKNCEGVESVDGTVKIAPCAPQLLPKTISSPSLLSHILVGKFCDSLPFYRQEQQFLRLGFALRRATMCNWAIKVADKCKPMIDLLRHELLSGPLINIDETRIQVLKEPERPAESNSFMWVYRGGMPEKSVVIYRYHPSRSGRVASDFLGDYRGIVQTDGYSGYDFLDTRAGIIHAGCWAHVRRKFLAVLGFKKVKNKRNIGGLGKAGKALEYIRELYAIEKDAREEGLGPDQLREERQQKSKPILKKFKEWLAATGPQIPPKSLLGKAFIYTQNQWPRLIKYLEDGNISMDNNLAENAIRPFVVGRKNWLFADVPGGAEAGATLYSLIETAKSNGLEPYRYFCYLFDKLPVAQGEEQLKALLPMNLTVEILEAHQQEYQYRWKISESNI
jgi:transposase